jgi:copper transport protein
MRHPAAALRAVLALGAAAAVLLGGPVIAGSALDRAAGLVVVGHSQLVSSSPGNGEVVPTPPTEIRLVFSEPIEPRYTSLDLLDSVGKAILVGVGAPDPADSHTLVAPIPTGTAFADVIYTVNWQAVSAADGHVTNGFITFGVGSVPGPIVAGPSRTTGDLHAGHSGGAAAAEIQGKVLAYGGGMLAFGLAILAWLVLRPAFGRIPRSAAYGAGIGLIAAGAGCLLLLVVGADSLPGAGAGGPGTDYLAFAIDSRVGRLLLGRIVVGALGGSAVLLLARFSRERGTAGAIVVGGVAGAASLVLAAGGGHASAFSSPVPIAMDVVHLGSASVWLSGLVMLGALTGFGGKGRLETGMLRRIVPRFSALALVSVALIALTGMYADWVQTRDLLAFETPYEVNLLVKILAFVLALGVGLLNYLDGGTERRWLGGLSRRLLLELVLGVAVLVISANLTSGSPTALDRPIAISPAVSTTVSAEPVDFAILPGRPGPNRFVAELPTPPVEGTTVELVLLRLDVDQGGSRIVMWPDFQSATPRFVADGSLPAGSRWDATVVATGPGGAEAARQRFVLALDAEAISEGRATPPLDPGLVVAILLLILGILGSGYALAGGVLPRTLPDASRPALLGASVVGAALGLAILVLGGPR